jgi:hypothetical protein
MTGSRWFLLATSILAGGLWAGWLVVLGLWLIWVGQLREASPVPWVPLGVFFVAGGQFVFMVLVADRVFRGALSAGRSALELVVAVLMVGALVGSVSSAL